MIFDDHDVHDDWNTSKTWVTDIRAQGWWDERIVGGFMSYWLYQHLGNLSPRELADMDLYARVREADDAGDILRDYVFKADREVEGTRWSYCRDIGPARLVMVDSRAGRVLDPGERSMVDEDEWRWIEEHATGDCDHLLIGTSLPLLLAPGMHYLEAWNEAVCDGAWGPVAAVFGEKLRQALDLEHWAAFGESLERMMGIVRAVGTRRARRAAGLDRRAVGRRPPRLPRRGRLPARHRHALDRVAGDVLAVPQPARQQGAHGHALHGLRAGVAADARAGGGGGRRGAERALALRPRRALVRQPGRDARARRAARRGWCSRRPWRRIATSPEPELKLERVFERDLS